MRYIKKYENVVKKDIYYQLYPFTKIQYFVDWFYKTYNNVSEFEGWLICNSSSSIIAKNFKSDEKYDSFWQIQKIDDLNILEDDLQAEKLAKEIGIILDSYNFGIIVGFNGINFLKNPEKIKDACYINSTMENKIKEYKIKFDANRYNL